jgi:hypothetical protein
MFCLVFLVVVGVLLLDVSFEVDFFLVEDVSEPALVSSSGMSPFFMSWFEARCGVGVSWFVGASIVWSFLRC